MRIFWISLLILVFFVLPLSAAIFFAEPVEVKRTVYETMEATCYVVTYYDQVDQECVRRITPQEIFSEAVFEQMIRRKQLSFTQNEGGDLTD